MFKIFVNLFEENKFFWPIAVAPLGLRCGPAAGPLLGLRVRVPPGASMSVSCQVGVYATGLSLIQRSSSE
jgi:hypothetical protein